MKFAIQLFFLAIILTACKKKPIDIEEILPPQVSKWELIQGDYKVYDTMGVFLYEMSISHSKGENAQGSKTDSLHFLNLDDNFNLSASQSQGCSNYCITIGVHQAVIDSINNRWNLFPYGSQGIYNNWRNDTIIFRFQKHNMPYWWNDGAIYFNGWLTHVAVKQH